MPCADFESLIRDLSRKFTRGRDDQGTDVVLGQSSVILSLLGSTWESSILVRFLLESVESVESGVDGWDQESLLLGRVSYNAGFTHNGFTSTGLGLD